MITLISTSLFWGFVLVPLFGLHFWWNILFSLIGVLVLGHFIQKLGLP